MLKHLSVDVELATEVCAGIAASIDKDYSPFIPYHFQVLGEILSLVDTSYAAATSPSSTTSSSSTTTSSSLLF